MIKDKYGKNLSTEQIMKKVVIRLKSYCLDFELMCLYFTGAVPSHHLRRFIYRISGITIGKGSCIHTYLRLFYPGNITIGEDSIIGDHVFLDGRDILRIGNHVDIASGVMIYNSQHEIDSKNFEAITKPVEIEDYVFIGPRSIILPGVKIGKGAVIGAGSVVTRSVDSFTVVGGVPAVKIRDRLNKNPSYKLGRARLFQ